MEVAILTPQDCLKRPPHHHHHHNNHPKPRRNMTHTPNPTPTNLPNRSNRRRRNSNSPPPSGPARTPSRTPSPPNMGQIRILKRGEDLPKPASPAPQKSQPRPVPAPRPGPFMMDGFYAGSACVTSPPPSELPLPAFFKRGVCGLDDNQKIASDLRRVLKLC